MRILLCLTAFMPLIFGCHNQETSPPAAITPEGVGQGNGIITYTNALLGLNFNYPNNWTLNESSDKRNVTINDRDLVPVDQISSLSFSYLPNLDGNRFNNFLELEKYLISQFPNKKWERVILLGAQSGYWVESDGLFEVGAFYVLDKSSFILKVDYRVKKHLNPESIIKAIMQTMFIDEEAPRVEKIWFENSEVRPGEKLKLFVQMRDNLSGINLEKLGNVKGFGVKGWPYDLNSDDGMIGYQLQPGGGYSGPIIDMVWAFPLRNSFKYVGDDVYLYEMIVPQFSPLGNLGLTTLDVEDRFGNKARVTLLGVNNVGLNKTYDVYGNSKTSKNIKAANILVIPPNFPDYEEDMTAPILKDAYFNKVFINGTSETIELTLELEDISNIPHQISNESVDDSYRQDIKIGFGPHDGHYGTCMKRIGKWQSFTKNVLKTQLDFSQCSSNFNRRLGQNKVNVRLTDVKLRDEVGHVLDIRFNLDDSPSDKDYPRAKFYIVW